MDHNKVLEFPAAVRGYHYYRSLWNPIPNQKLKCSHEENKPFDMFAIEVSDDVKFVRHLFKYLLDKGVVFTVKLISTNYRRSPLIQGGLEILAKITVTIFGTVISHLLMEKYKEIVNERYTGPKDEELLGLFWLYHQLDKRARKTRDLGKSRNGEGRPKKIITDKVKTSDSFFVKSRKRTKARLTWLWKKEKNKTNTDPVTITID